MEDQTTNTLQESASGQAEAKCEDTAADAAPLKRADEKKQYFSARRIAYIATFAALAFAVRFLQFPILPAVPFLKFDFSDTFVLICAYALGPIAGIITGIMKEAIYGIFFTSSAFIGELANILIMIPFVLIPSIIYKKHKGLKSVLIWLTVACLVRTVWSIPVNLLLNFPAFMGFNWQLGMSMFWKLWQWTTLFNLIKNIILAATVVLLYKSVSRFIAMIDRKFAKENAGKKKQEPPLSA